MGVTALLGRLAARRVHVLLVEVRGYWLLRAEVERALLARGWGVAVSSADADVVAVCGVPGLEMAQAVTEIWEEMPGPRIRVDIASVEVIDSALDRAVAELLDPQRHRDDERKPLRLREKAHGHGEMGHSSHGDMGHGGMAPAGIALAAGGEDRDGLEMDVLDVRLGPVLAHWPAGLVLRCSLQGDVLTGAEASIIDAGSGDDARPGAQSGAAYVVARQCGHIVDLLALAGWPRAAAIARQARDLLLDETQVGRAQSLLEELHRTVRRSRLVRWSLGNLSPLTAERLQHLELPAALAGDAYDRLLARVDYARGVLSNGLSPNGIALDGSRVIDALPNFVVGLDMATTRLVIASLGIDTSATRESSRHG